MSILNFSHVRALVQFKESREIVDVGGQINGGSAVAASVKVTSSTSVAPGVSTMDAGYGLDMLHAMLATEEDVWIRIHPSSGFPEVLLVDAFREHEIDPSMGQTHRYGLGFLPTANRITRAWTRVRGKMRAPLIFPPTSRYTHGINSDVPGIYPIGGWIADDDTDYLRWTVIIEASSLPPHGVGADAGNAAYHCQTASAVQGAADEAGTVLLYSPLFPLSATYRMGSETDAGAMMIGAKSAMTNIVLRFMTYDNDASNNLGVALISECDSSNDTDDIGLEDFAHHWLFRVQAETKNIDGFEQGDLPVDSQIRIHI